jgi:Protein of unknown function (DUF3987)
MTHAEADRDDVEFTISTFRSTTDTHPRPVRTTWAGLQHALTRHLVLVDKMTARLWSPAVYGAGATRGNAGVIEVSVLAFDVDDGTTTDALGYWLNDLEHIITSSYSHKPEQPKLRVVIRLTEPIPTDVFDDVWRRANQHLLHGHVDPSTKDAACIFFVPSGPPGAERVALLHAGRALDWRALPPPPSRRASWRGVRVNGAPTGAGDDMKRAHGLLGKFARDLAQTPDGERHFVLLQKARAAGGLKASGLLSQHDIETALFDASVANGEVAKYGEVDVLRAIRDGIAYGEQAAWVPDDLPDSVAWTSGFQARRNGYTVDTETGEVLEPNDEHHDPGDAQAPEPLPAIPEFPLGILPRPLRAVAEESSLPAALLAGGMLAACAAAVGGWVEIMLSLSLIERAIVFVSLLAPRGSGKSPSLRIAFGPIEAYDHKKQRDFKRKFAEWAKLPPNERRQKERPGNAAILRSGFSMEAMERQLCTERFDTAYKIDELSIALEGLNEYKRNGSGNRGRLLERWEGDVLRYQRVGEGGGTHNAVDLYEDRPTPVIVGGLQTYLHRLLGEDRDGLRPRWLPHLATLPEAQIARYPTAATSDAYAAVLERLLERRERRRRWEFSDDDVRVRFEELQLDWKTRAEDVDASPAVSAFLSKADRQCLRIAVTLAEVWQHTLAAVANEQEDWVVLRLPLPILEAAALWIEFIVECWRALPGAATLSLTPRDQKLDEACDRVAEYLEERHTEVQSNVLRERNVAGISTAADLHAVLLRYGERWPGAVRKGESGPHGGRPPVLVSAPPRQRRKPHQSPAGAP